MRGERGGEHPPCLMDELPALGDHAAPCRRVGRHRQADEGQDRLDNDRNAHFETHQRQQCRDHVWQQISHKDMERRKPMACAAVT